MQCHQKILFTIKKHNNSCFVYVRDEAYAARIIVSMFTFNLSVEMWNWYSVHYILDCCSWECHLDGKLTMFMTRTLWKQSFALIVINLCNKKINWMKNLCLCAVNCLSFNFCEFELLTKFTVQQNGRNVITENRCWVFYTTNEIFLSENYMNALAMVSCILVRH